MSKVAVASTDGIFINEHFGRSKEFLIYEVDEKGEYKFLERRENIPHDPNESHGHIVTTTAELLADVEVVLVKQIGPGAEQELRNKGVIALSVNSSIEKALQAYGKRGKFIKNGIRRSGSGCQSSCGSGSCGSSSRGCK
jgi:nitrogen fixation protein NifX